MSSLERVIATLRAGGVACFPTETLWSLSARADDPACARAIFEAKRRPEGVPLAVGFATWGQARQHIDAGPAGDALAKRFLPGPLSIVAPRRTESYAHCAPGLGTLSVRVPDHPIATRILDACGPLVMTSANAHGAPDPIEASDITLNVPVVGDRVPGTPSTVVDVAARRVLREGMITEAEVDAAWP